MVNLQQYQIDGVARETELIQSVFTGNVIPREFYQIITTKSGTPDHVAITIFSEIIYWYRPSKEGAAKFKLDAWQSSYAHFEQKFGYYHEKVRRAFVRLEELGFVQREFRAVEHYGQKYPNRLFIHLTNEAFELISKSAPKPEVKKPFKEKSSILPKFVEVSPQIVGDYIKETKNISNNRSMDLESDDPKSESNSFNLILNADLGKKIEASSNQQISKQGVRLEADISIQSLIKPGPTLVRVGGLELIPKKTLSDFYPLNEEDCTLLQSKSGRDFNLNAMNEILLSMSKRLVDRAFRSKQAFLSYMSKALASEMRQAEKINNASFRIKFNKTKEEKSLEEKEKFLGTVEQSRDVSDLAKLKRKISGCFDTEKAYDIIQSIKQVSRSTRGKVKIEFNKFFDLLERDKEIIYNEIISVFNISGDLTKKDIELVLPDKKTKYCNLVLTKKPEIKAKLPDNVWGRVRKGLIGEFGEGVDISWFSKLHEQIDENSKKLILKAPTSFMRDWVNSHYKSMIKLFAESLGFDLEEIRLVE